MSSESGVPGQSTSDMVISGQRCDRDVNKPQSSASTAGRTKSRWTEKLSNLRGRVRGLFKFMSDVDAAAGDRAVLAHEHKFPAQAPASNLELHACERMAQGEASTSTVSSQSDVTRPTSQQPQRARSLGRIATFTRSLRSIFSGLIRDGSRSKISSRDRDATPAGPQQSLPENTSQAIASNSTSVTKENRQIKVDMSQQQPDEGGIFDTSIAREDTLLHTPQTEDAACHRESNVIAVCEDLPPGMC